MFDIAFLTGIFIMVDVIKISMNIFNIRIKYILKQQNVVVFKFPIRKCEVRAYGGCLDSKRR